MRAATRALRSRAHSVCAPRAAQSDPHRTYKSSQKEYEQKVKEQVAVLRD